MLGPPNVGLANDDCGAVNEDDTTARLPDPAAAAELRLPDCAKHWEPANKKSPIKIASLRFSIIFLHGWCVLSLENHYFDYRFNKEFCCQFFVAFQFKRPLLASELGFDSSLSLKKTCVIAPVPFLETEKPNRTKKHCETERELTSRRQQPVSLPRPSKSVRSNPSPDRFHSNS